jgi:hypothetical protein
MKSILSLIGVTTVCHAFCAVVLLAVFGVTEAAAQISNANPRLLFTDLESGPNTGGEDNLGAFITLYGEGFGAQRGNSTVTIGSVEVAKYVSWGQDNAFARSLDMIVLQPGPNVQSGKIVVTVNGHASNPLPFTVRSGNIYFVIPDASNASDSNLGTFDQPFKTLYRQSGQLAAGDIVYVKGGTFNTVDTRYPGWDCVLCFFPDNDVTGTASTPIAWVGYPGKPPVLGAPLPMRRGLFVDETIDYYIIANMRFTAYGGMMELRGDGHRIVGNYLYDGIYSNGGVIGISGNSAHYKIYGNRLRNNGEPGNKLNGSGFYLQGFGTNEDIDFGWNHVEDQRGARSIQVFGHVDGDRVNNIRIHDNLLIGPELNNIVLGGSDGNSEILGTAYVYNNILVGSGTSGLRVNDLQGTVFIYNNVLYNNGSNGIYEDEHAQFQVQRAGTGLLTFRNNILYAESGETYYWLEPGLLPSVLNAGNNLWFNAGTAPAWDVHSVNADPLFVHVSTKDFHLQPGSPAIDTGINTGVASDYEGVSRPQGRAFDIGAYEYTSGGVSVDEDRVTFPDSFSLEQNYPNPFNPSTTISYSLPKSAIVTLRIFNALGQGVATLMNEWKMAGYYQATWNASNVPSGIYFYRLQAGEYVETKKMILLH